MSFKPLAEGLENFIKTEKASFHVPGHKGRDFGGADAGDILKRDVTELEGLDDLHGPGGIIKEAEKKAAEKLAAELKEKAVTVTAKAGQNGRLFGSVTTKEVAEALKAQYGLEVDRRRITMADIKAHGTYEAEIKLLAGISTKFRVIVKDQ